MRISLYVFDVYLEVDPRAKLFFILFGVMIGLGVSSAMIDKDLNDKTAFVLFVTANLMLIPVGYTCYKFIKIRHKEIQDR